LKKIKWIILLIGVPTLLIYAFVNYTLNEYSWMLRDSNDYNLMKSEVKRNNHITFSDLDFENLNEWDRMGVFDYREGWTWENVSKIMNVIEGNEYVSSFSEGTGEAHSTCIVFAKDKKIVGSVWFNTYDIDISPKQKTIRKDEAIFKVSRSWDIIRLVRTINLTWRDVAMNK